MIRVYVLLLLLLLILKREKLLLLLLGERIGAKTSISQRLFHQLREEEALGENRWGSLIIKSPTLILQRLLLLYHSKRRDLKINHGGARVKFHRFWLLDLAWRSASEAGSGRLAQRRGCRRELNL